MKKLIEIKPVVTEKSLNKAHTLNQYTFRVSDAANKNEIAKEVETKFKVKVEKVALMNVIGQSVTWGRSRVKGIKPSYKKAIVTVKSGDTISDFDIK